LVLPFNIWAAIATSCEFKAFYPRQRTRSKPDEASSIWQLHLIVLIAPVVSMTVFVGKRMAMAMIMVRSIRVVMVMISAMRMAVRSVMRVIVVMLTMVQTLTRPGPARILAEHQGFDGHGHGI
jgi:hypothetical protein